MKFIQKYNFFHLFKFPKVVCKLIAIPPKP